MMIRGDCKCVNRGQLKWETLVIKAAALVELKVRYTEYSEFMN
jgi:hypothetical protein